MRITKLLLALLFATTCVLFSCTSKNEIPTFEEVYPQVLTIVDNPDSTDSNVFSNCNITKLYDAKWEEDSMPMRMVIYGNGMKVNGDKANYHYTCSTEKAFAISISMFMDPIINFKFKSKEAADKFYNEILDYGVVEDNFNCIFVTDKKLKPGITKVKDLSDYSRCIGITKPQKTDDGLYSISMAN